MLLRAVPQSEVWEVDRKDGETTVLNLEVEINGSREGNLKLDVCYGEDLSDDPKKCLSPNRGDLNDLDEQDDRFTEIERMALRDSIPTFIAHEEKLCDLGIEHCALECHDPNALINETGAESEK